MKVIRTIEINETRHLLKVVKPFFLAGQSINAGRVVETSIMEASNLITRGLAVEATQAEVNAEPQIAVSPPEKITRDRA